MDADTATGSVHSRVVDGSVLVTTIDRPHARNAIDGEVASGLLAAAERLDSDPALRVGVLHGAGEHFCAGMDLRAFQVHGAPKDLMPFLTVRRTKPTIAAIEGFALAGGLELALTCDLVVAGYGAKLGVPEVKVGLFAAGGALCRLPERVPLSVAMELALTGDAMTAVDAHRFGLVNRLVDDGEALEAALGLARSIGRNAPLAVAASRELVWASREVDESEFWRRQAPVIREVFTSDDAREGATAFTDKRRPVWTGR